ncbi:hypothetical protein, partial [Mesorhizobium sp.]
MTNRLSAAGAPDGNQVLDSIALNDKEASSSPSRTQKSRYSRTFTPRMASPVVQPQGRPHQS